MSCIYLNLNHYQQTANQLFKLCYARGNGMDYHKTRKLFFADTGLISEIEANILAFTNRLMQWNRAAYFERYAHKLNTEKKQDIPDRLKTIQPVEFKPYQLLMWLQCIDYQCSDSTEYNDSYERETLDAIIQDIKDTLITTHSDYKAATWCAS